MPSIPIPTLKFGKIKERSQICEVLTDDGRWPDKELPVWNSVAVDEMTGMAFLLDPENQYLAEDGFWHQIVTEKSAIPLFLRKENYLADGDNDKKDLEDITDELFKLTKQQKKSEVFSKAKQAEIWNKILWVVSIVCGCALIIAFMNWL